MAKQERSALIVGASRGLGLGLVRAFLARGWDVTATSRGEAPALSSLSPVAPAQAGRAWGRASRVRHRRRWPQQ